MEATITDVTRMRAPNLCIAADHEGRAIRFDQPQPNETWMRSVGDLVPGDIVTVSWRPKRDTEPPHVEDGRWDRLSVKKVRRLTEAQLIDYLAATALDSVRMAFGEPWFLSKAGNAAFKPGIGRRSLALIHARSVTVYPHFEGVRVDFEDSDTQWAKVPFEDFVVRRHQSVCQTCKGRRLATLLATEFNGAQALMRLGLTRPFHTPQYPPACWLQVNHIFLTPTKRQHFV